MSVLILGIESSCDETAASICKDGQIISNQIATQRIHETYGGVVPELASRAHQQNIIPIINACFRETNIHPSELSAIAYTQGPGLLGALLVGSSFAKAFSYSLGIPTIPVNHMQAHILAHFIEDPKPAFPFLCLTVSGGHTQLVVVKDYDLMNVIGTTVDDAAGEAFDKGAKLMGLGYPGGPKIDALARLGDENRFTFPMSEMQGYKYSFSGIKTAFMYFLRDQQALDPDFIRKNEADLAASLQKTLIDMLMGKLKKAAKAHHINQIAIAGGVSANSGLRERLMAEGAKLGWQVFIPEFEYCTDNAGMIAITGYFKFLKNQFGSLTDSPLPRMNMHE